MKRSTFFLANTALAGNRHCAGKYSHVKTILQKINWLPVKQRIDFKILITTYKCIYSAAPKYLCDLLLIKKYGRLFRSSSQILLQTLYWHETGTVIAGNGHCPGVGCTLLKYSRLFPQIQSRCVCVREYVCASACVCSVQKRTGT